MKASWTVEEISGGRMTVEIRQHGDWQEYRRFSFHADGVTKTAVEVYLGLLLDHIAYVREAGQRLGVELIQLRIHDSSKFGLEEFPYYVRQYHGDGGDPDGYAAAWLHHVHCNAHHWQHWIFPEAHTPRNSNVERGVVPMPLQYVQEMVADWMGFGMAHHGTWDIGEWLHETMPRIRVHSVTAVALRSLLDGLGYADVVHMQRFAHEVEAA